MTFLGLTLMALCRSGTDSAQVQALPEPQASADTVPTAPAIPTAQSRAATRDIRLDDRTVEGHTAAEPVSVRTLGRGELSQGATLGDVLAMVPGVEVRRMGGVGGFTEVQLRMCPSQQVRVFVDGVELRDDGSSRSDLGNLSVESLEKVEIVQGAGGDGRPELRLTSRQGWNRLGGTLTAGSFGERQAGAWWGDSSGTWSLAGWAQTADNDWPFYWDHGTKWNTSDDAIVHLPNNDYTGYGAGLGWRPTASTQGMLRVEHSEKGITGLYTANPKARYARTQGQLSLDSRSEAAWDIPWQAALRLSTSRWRDSAGGLDYRSNLEADELGGSGSGSVALVHQEGGWFDGSLRLGGSHERSSWESTTPRQVHLTPDASRTRGSLALAWKGQNLSGTFGAGVSGRIERVQDGSDVASSALDAAVAVPDSSWGRTAQDAQARLWVRTPDRSIQAWISGSESVRVPDFYEIYGDNGSTIANYRLEPEESWTAELGLRGTWGPLALGMQPWLGLYKKPIRRTMIGASLVSRYENDSGYVARGIDGDAALCTRYGSAKVQGGWSQTSLRSDLAAYRGRELGRSPRWRWNSTLSSPVWQGLQLEELATYTGSSWSTALNGPKDRIDGHTLHGLRLSWRRGPFALVVQGDNLTNEEFEEFADAPLAGRSWRVRIEWNQPKETK